VEKKLFVVHLWTLCQKQFMPLSAVYVGVRRSAPYVSMGQRRPLAMRWNKQGRTPALGEERPLTKVKIARARDSLCLKWCVGERAGVNQLPSHLTTPEGWQRWPYCSMEAVEGGVLWLGVRHWISCVLGNEQDTPMSRPLADMVENNSCRLLMLLL